MNVYTCIYCMCVLIRFESLIWKHKISISRQTTMSCHQSHTSTFSQPTYCNNWNIAARLDYFIYRCGGSSTGLTTSAYSSAAQYRTPYCDDKLHQGRNQHQTAQRYFCVVQQLREKIFTFIIYYILLYFILLSCTQHLGEFVARGSGACTRRAALQYHCSWVKSTLLPFGNSIQHVGDRFSTMFPRKFGLNSPNQSNLFHNSSHYSCICSNDSSI